MKFTQKNVYIALFALLYISVALVSTIHAVAFFSLANALALGVVLAITFEIGQAAVLFSILTTPQERSKIMPWCLMTILTIVQVMGNVFSSYKYLITNSVNELRYFKEPIFVWMELPDAQANVILTYIIGAILPIVALCMTSMLTNYLEDNKKEALQQTDIEQDELEIRNSQIANSEVIEEPVQKQNAVEQTHAEEQIDKTEEQQLGANPQSLNNEESTTTTEQTDNETEIVEQDYSEEEVKTEETKETEVKPTIEDKQVEELMTKPSSHFINL